VIVAEAGINHNGDLAVAMSMIRVAKAAGCDAIKFQTYFAESLCEPAIPFTYKSRCREVTEDMQEMFKRNEFSVAQWNELKAECDGVGIEFMSTPMCKRSLDLVVELGVKRIKVASSDLTNIPLLEEMEKTLLPVILSLGMADGEDSNKALELFGLQRTTFAACTSEYPTPPEHVNISRIKGSPLCKVGLSDHTIGNTAAIMAVAYGATYFEKHFTLDNSMEGPDHWFSANPAQLMQWVNAIKKAQLMVGSGRIEPTEQEKVNRKVWRKTEENGYIRRNV